MNKTDQVQGIVEEFQRESSLRQVKFWQSLEHVLIFLIFITIAGFAYLMYMAGSFYRAFFIGGFGVLFLVGSLWSIHKNPKKHMKAPRPLSPKERIWWWVSFIIVLFGLWILNEWL